MSNAVSPRADSAAATDGARILSLDGLRALAILLVIVHNAGSLRGSLDGVMLRVWALVSNAGWIGVQLFFALSGFLITRILLDSKASRHRLRNFYARRVLRIVPVYYVLLVIVFAVAPHVAGLAPVADRGSRSALWYFTYFSNWIAPFGGMAVALPHVWSLAVEEQFYLAWPWIVAVSSERALARVCIAMAIAALAIRMGLHLILAPAVASSADYTWTIARCDAIALGALVAIALRNSRARSALRDIAPIGFAATSALLVVAMLAGRGLGSEGWLAEVVGQPLSAVWSTFVVACCVTDLPTRDGWRRASAAARRVLATRPLVAIGKYSYAIYVFHLPIHHIIGPTFVGALENGSNTRRLVAHAAYSTLVFVVSAIVARISWSLIERPFLSLKRFVPMAESPDATRTGEPGMISDVAEGRA